MDNSICINNIYAISKSKGIKIGDLEESVELSKGYFARLKREGESFPAVDKLYSISKKLNVSMDDLMCEELAEMPPDEMVIFQFLEKLYNDSKKHHVLWNKSIYSESEDENDNEKDKDCNAAILQLRDSLGGTLSDDEGYPYKVNQVGVGTYYSTRLPGSEMQLVLSGTYVYSYFYDVGPEEWSNQRRVGLYMIGEKNETVWEDTNSRNETLQMKLLELFNLINRETHTSNSLKSSMKSYLEYDFGLSKGEE